MILHIRTMRHLVVIHTGLTNRGRESAPEIPCTVRIMRCSWFPPRKADRPYQASPLFLDRQLQDAKQLGYLKVKWVGSCSMKMR